MSEWQHSAGWIRITEFLSNILLLQASECAPKEQCHSKRVTKLLDGVAVWQVVSPLRTPSAKKNMESRTTAVARAHIQLLSRGSNLGNHASQHSTNAHGQRPGSPLTHLPSTLIALPPTCPQLFSHTHTELAWRASTWQADDRRGQREMRSCTLMMDIGAALGFRTEWMDDE